MAAKDRVDIGSILSDVDGYFLGHFYSSRIPASLISFFKFMGVTHEQMNDFMDGTPQSEADMEAIRRIIQKKSVRPAKLISVPNSGKPPEVVDVEVAA